MDSDLTRLADEAGKRPDLRVGVTGDVHVPVAGSERFRRVLAAFDARRVDAVLVCGDLTNYGLVRELALFRDEWQRAFPENRRSDGGTVVPLFIYGDHDTGGYMHKFDDGVPPCTLHGLDKDAMEQEIIPDVGSAAVWKSVFGTEWDYVQVCDVKGYRFILSHYYGSIHQETPPGLESTFADAVRGLDPARPFFFVQHRVFPETVDAFPFELEWWCADNAVSKDLLSRYPNAVGICGHAHSNLRNDGNLWRGVFSAVEVPSLHELGLPRSTGERRKFDNSSAQCLVMDVWPDRVVFERLDAMEDKPVAPDWVISTARGRNAFRCRQGGELGNLPEMSLPLSRHGISFFERTCGWHGASPCRCGIGGRHATAVLRLKPGILNLERRVAAWNLEP